MKNLRKLRDSRNLSQQKLGDAVGVTQQTIYGYENGLYEPDIGLLTALADYFETSIDYIVGRTDQPRKIEKVEAFDLNEQEAVLVEKFRKLSPKGRDHIIKTIDVIREK